MVSGDKLIIVPARHQGKSELQRAFYDYMITNSPSKLAPAFGEKFGKGFSDGMDLHKPKKPYFDKDGNPYLIPENVMSEIFKASTFDIDKYIKEVQLMSNVKYNNEPVAVRGGFHNTKPDIVWEVRNVEVEHSVPKNPFLDRNSRIKIEVEGHVLDGLGAINPVVYAENIRRLLNNQRVQCVPEVPVIKDVIFNPPATIVFWNDGTKTVVKAKDEDFDPEKGITMAYFRKCHGDKYEYFDEIRKYVGRYEKKRKKSKK